MTWLIFVLGFLLGFALSSLIWWFAGWLEARCWDYGRGEKP
jgi:hypothetical protein